MAKANLTDQQKNIIKLMTDEFKRLNSVTTEPQGLIDVAGIMEQARLEKQFNHECDVANETFKKLKIDAMLKDMESVRADLAKLNLGIKRSYPNSESIEIYTAHVPYEQVEHYNKFRVKYKTSHYYERKLGNIKRTVDAQYCVSFELNSIFHTSRETFAELIATNEFKDRIKLLYVATLK